MGRVKRIWYLSPMRTAKVQASLRIRAVSPEPPLLAHTSSEPRGTFRQKARSLAPLNGWACAVKIWHDEMLEDTNRLTRPILCLCKFKLFIKACHFLALILVQSCASDVEDTFWTSIIGWLIVVCALSYPCKRTLSIRWGVPSVFRCT